MNVVIAISVDSATPYAPAMLVELPNPITSAHVTSINAQLTVGTKICPISRDEVCSILSRGLYPSCTACRVRENAPEMIACEAMTAAAVARATSGYKAHDGAMWKN